LRNIVIRLGCLMLQMYENNVSYVYCRKYGVRSFVSYRMYIYLRLNK